MARAWSFRPITTPAAPISRRIASDGSGTEVPPDDEDEEDELGMPPEVDEEVLEPPDEELEVELDVELWPPEVDVDVEL
ncbi:MAG TPA: hypothetical protein VGC28_09290 [Sphingomonas sp.]